MFSIDLEKRDSVVSTRRTLPYTPAPLLSCLPSSWPFTLLCSSCYGWTACTLPQEHDSAMISSVFCIISASLLTASFTSIKQNIIFSFIEKMLSQPHVHLINSLIFSGKAISQSLSSHSLSYPLPFDLHWSRATRTVPLRAQDLSRMTPRVWAWETERKEFH